MTRPNQMWAMDITYIPMARGFVCLVAVLDRFSRKVLVCRLSTTLETGPCIKALKEAMRRHGKPEIMHADQSSQFTSIGFIKTLQNADIQISKDGNPWAGQCLGRTALADDQTRRSLPARL